ncbi:TetR family transcriptional regulator [Sodalis sp. dw_96]|uniref:TetR family transcriptional regulator n=1 Tax=Sodalis sp. dw_96 TaxID=2719794 RepID=UPI001BD690AF|nr:TetR family transcriptional regulator [Sodalis sp. dw_96]
MVRMTVEDAKITRQRILLAAADVISREGWAAATLCKIAEHAGMTRGAIYWHFRDKNDVLVHLLENRKMPFDDLPDDKNIVALWEAITEVLLNIANDQDTRMLMQILLLETEWSSLEPSVRCKVTTMRSRLNDCLKKATLSLLLRRARGGQDQDVEKKMNCLLWTQQATLTGLLFELLIEPSIPEREQSVRFAVDMLVQGISLI